MTDPYYKSRYVWNKDRLVVWKEIVKYLAIFLPKDGTVVDIGAGYCDFINNVEAKKRIALDYSPDLEKYADSGVITIQSSVTNMDAIDTGSADVVFASNLFEHLADPELEATMGEVKRILKKGGRLILMQPNYRLSYKTYFDDHTHKKVFSDISLETFLLSHNMEIELKKSRFMPFSLKSRPGFVPLFGWIVRLYLHSPFKPFAGQMLFVAKNDK